MPVEVLDWADQSINWTKKSLVIIGPVWNYHNKWDQFNAWLSILESHNIKVYNDVKFIKWNMNKRYLTELQDNTSIKFPPTLIVDKKNKKSIQ